MTARDKSWLRLALTENLGLKAIALIASIGLFIIVRGPEEAQTTIPVHVDVLPPPADSPKMLVSEIPDEIRVTLRGSSAVLASVRRDGLGPVRLDLRNTSVRFYYFEPEFDLPAGATLVQIAPQPLPLTWVDRLERSFAIEPVLDGELRDGLVIGQPARAQPDHVRVRGAASEINRLERIRTSALSLAGLGVGEVRRSLRLAPPPDHTEYVGVDSVMVTLRIEEQEGDRTMRGVEVAVMNGSLALRPARVVLRVTGPRVVVDAIDPATLVPFVDASAIDPARGAQSIAVQVRGAPEGATVSAEPAEVLATAARPAAPH